MRSRVVTLLPLSALVAVSLTAFAQTGRIHLSRKRGSFYLVGCASDRGSMKVSWSTINPNRINGIGTLYQGAIPPPLAASLTDDCSAVRQIYGVNAPMILVTEEGSPNAAATQIVLSPSGSDGTVFFGTKLITNEFQLDRGYGIPTIIGHEFAHVLQMKNRLPVSSVHWRELHADFMAGWFTALRAHFRPQNVDASALSIFTKGDWAFNDPGHHGTPEERLAAFKAGVIAQATGQAMDADAAYRQGLEYIKSQGAEEDITDAKGDDSNRGTTPDSDDSPDGNKDDSVPYFLQK